MLTPYVPVPESNGEEWDRIEQASALDALVELALHGEYNGMDGEQRLKDGLELRGSAVAVFEVTLETFSELFVLTPYIELCSQRGDQTCNPTGNAPARRIRSNFSNRFRLLPNCILEQIHLNIRQ